MTDLLILITIAAVYGVGELRGMQRAYRHVARINARRRQDERDEQVRRYALELASQDFR